MIAVSCGAGDAGTIDSNTVGTVTLNAPGDLVDVPITPAVDGRILVLGSGGFHATHSNSLASQAHLGLAVDSTVMAGSDQTLQMECCSATNGRRVAFLQAVAPVTAGTHDVALRVVDFLNGFGNTSSGQLVMQNATVTVVFLPDEASSGGGASSISGFVSVEQSSATDSSDTKSVTVVCPGSTKVIGGGGRIDVGTASITDLVMAQSDRTLGLDNRWTVFAYERNGTSSIWAVSATVFCANV